MWVGWVGGIVLWPGALKATADRWVVAAAFATVLSGTVLAAFSWWAGRDERGDQQPDGPRHVQEVRAYEGGTVYAVMDGIQQVTHGADGEAQGGVENNSCDDEVN